MNLAHGWIARVMLAVVLLDPVSALDQRVRGELQTMRGAPYERIMRAATDAGNPRNLFAVMVVVAVAGGPAGPILVREAVAVLLPANLVVEGLKRAVNRTRPDGSQDRDNASFPSSHAANVCALAYLLARRWRGAAWVAWPLAILVSFSRMWLDRHFLSDVVAGALIGVGSAWWVTRWARGAGRDWVQTGRYGKR
jgi:undecaprenyl-diphosphatase